MANPKIKKEFAISHDGLFPRSFWNKIQKRYGLTDREVQVLHVLCHGKGNAEIADTLFIDVETVRSHLKNIFTKTRQHKRAALMARVVHLWAGVEE